MYPFELAPLPFPHDALASVMSPQTVDFHYGKHHKGYVDKLNELVKGKPFAEMSLEQIILETAHKEADKSIFNNAAQVWNHDFYWKCLNPKAPHKPVGDLEAAMEKSFGSFEDFQAQFKQAALDQFGSGYIWLCSDHFGKVQITKSANALNPLTMDLKPLLTVDIWEHAYYLDFQNRRADFVDEVIEKLLDWEFADENYSQI